MSIEALSWAFKEPLPSGPKFVLVALCDHADEEWCCFPGQDKLAAKTGLSVRAVRRNIGLLEKAGYLRREKRFGKDGSRTSDRYRISQGEPFGTVCDSEEITTTGQNDRRPNSALTTGQNVRVTISEPSDILNSGEDSEKPETLEQAVEREFPVWYANYPRRKAPEAAKKAYRAARKRGVSAEILLQQAKRFAFLKADTDPKYIAHPATWLNEARYFDEPDGAAPSPRGEGERPDPARDQWRAFIILYFRDGFWDEGRNGPKPDAPLKPGAPTPAWQQYGFDIQELKREAEAM